MSGLRVCRVCGMTAKNESDLNLFVKNKLSLYGRDCICKSCKNGYNKRYKEKHPEKHIIDWKKYDSKRSNNRMTYKGKTIRFGHNPRTNICSKCGKKYPQELERQTHLHHINYHDDDVLKGTVELCEVCHGKLHNPPTLYYPNTYIVSTLTKLH